MNSEVQGFSDLISTKKPSPLKFAWDKFKEIGAIRPAANTASVAPVATRPAADPVHARAKEYQELVTKRAAISARPLVLVKPSEAKPTLPRWTARVLTQGLHQAAPKPRLDLVQAKAAGIQFLFGGC